MYLEAFVNRHIYVFFGHNTLTPTTVLPTITTNIHTKTTTKTLMELNFIAFIFFSKVSCLALSHLVCENVIANPSTLLRINSVKQSELRRMRLPRLARQAC